jgi:polyhydroxybutyrate depolymerase
MKSWRSLSSSSSFFWGSPLAALFLLACSSGADAPPNGGGSGGRTAETGSGGSSPAAGSGGSPGSGGTVGSGGSAAAGTGGATGGSGMTGGGGAAGSGAVIGSGGAGAPGSGGRVGSGGAGGSGSGGTAAPGGRGGSAPGSGGAGGATDMAAPKPSAGCEKTTSQTPAQWVESMVMSGSTTRPYSVRLPGGYDPTRPYPVIVVLHGCGSGTNNVPMEKPAGMDAIVVRGTGTASGTCWDTSATGPDVAFFDAMVADTKARFCADEGRVFAVGYSSGSWLVNQLTCIRSNVLRGGASVTGGEAASGTCKGGVARIFVHDKDDTTNVISGSEKARDRQLTQNGCDKSVAPVAQDPSPCVRYASCPPAYPVEWCATSGQMHNRQDSFAPTLFWNFFKALP